MKVSNLATAALLTTLKRNKIDENLLVAGTEVNLEQLRKHNKHHRWSDFCKMYENCSFLLGHENAVREIAHLGIYDEGISKIRKMGYSLFDAKMAYWSIAAFVGKYLFKECVTFDYTKIHSNHIRMEININEQLEDCPLLLETYAHLFEEVPCVLGLSKALVNAQISERKGIYNIQLQHTSFLKFLHYRFFKSAEGHNSSIALMAELENQTAELSKALDEKSKLLRVLCHDVANQSTIIDFYLKKAMHHKELPLETLNYLEIANKSSTRLSSTLKNVQNLEISAIRGMVLEPVDINLVFQALSVQFKPQLENKGVTLKCINLLPSDIYPMAEKSSLEINVLGNLLSNAIKFSPEHSVIELQASYENETVLVSVRDQGAGISPQQLRNIFTKEIRNSTIGTHGEIGTGFGLGIVNNYVKSYGGRVSYQRNLPTGANFTVELSPHLPIN